MNDTDVGQAIIEQSWLPEPSRRQLLLASIRIRSRIEAEAQQQAGVGRRLEARRAGEVG